MQLLSWLKGLTFVCVFVLLINQSGFSQVKTSPDKSNLVGNFVLLKEGDNNVLKHDTAFIYVNMASRNTIQFYIRAIRGPSGHIGDLAGICAFIGNFAVFNYGKCQVTFNFSNDTLIVRQMLHTSCNRGGINAVFTGTYVKVSDTVPKFDKSFKKRFYIYSFEKSDDLKQNTSVGPSSPVSNKRK